jgi:hypothetical protein
MPEAVTGRMDADFLAESCEASGQQGQEANPRVGAEEWYGRVADFPRILLDRVRERCCLGWRDSSAGLPAPLDDEFLPHPPKSSTTKPHARCRAFLFNTKTSWSNGGKATNGSALPYWQLAVKEPHLME